MVVLIDGTDYVRSIQKAGPDGSLTFYSAIDEGLVLRVAEGMDLVSDLEATMGQLSEELGPPQLVLACDCILRNLEVTQKNTKMAVEAVFDRHNTVGFSTYGEQYGGVHMNQTLTGIAIGACDHSETSGSSSGWSLSGSRTERVMQSDAAQPMPRRQLGAEQLQKMVQALMDRAERSTSVRGSGFSLFQTAVMLEDQVRARTKELEAALRENEQINRALQQVQEDMEREIRERREALVALEREREEQQVLIGKLEEAHNQLLQSEKLASIGQLAAGVAHEINNPIGFVSSNLNTLRQYIDDLLRLVDLYETVEPSLTSEAAERIAQLKTELELDYLREDVGALIAESIDGTARVRRIVQDLRDFSRTGATDWQLADLHQGLESTLNVATNEIKYKATIVRSMANCRRSSACRLSSTRSSSICWSMRLRQSRSTAPSRCAPAAKAIRCGSLLPMTGRGYLPSCSRVSSTPFSPPSRSARAPASACRSPMASCRNTGGASSWIAAPERARPSPSGCQFGAYRTKAFQRLNSHNNPLMSRLSRIMVVTGK